MEQYPVPFRWRYTQHGHYRAPTTTLYPCADLHHPAQSQPTRHRPRPPTSASHYTVDNCGKLTLRNASRLHHLGIGRSHARTKVLILIIAPTAAIDDGIAPRRSFARLGVVERQSSRTGDDDARLCWCGQWHAEAWLNLSAMPGDEVQKRVAEVAKTLYQRTDELAVLLASAITRVRGRRRGCSAVGAEALPQIA
jgi:hypothetical protein